MFDQSNKSYKPVSKELEFDAMLAVLPRKNGEIVFDGIVLKSKLGEGGNGSVYLGLHTRLNIPVAVKMLKESECADRPAFEREAHLTVSIEHPNVVRIFDLKADSVIPYIVMEYVEGTSAYDLLVRKIEQSDAPLGQVAALEIGLSTAKALGAIHEAGIVHGDVKCDNILIRARDGAVKLTDLGFAAVRHMNDNDTRRTNVAGTLGFISPEALRGERPVPASDIYALGVTLFELLTGAFPYEAPYDDGYFTRQMTREPNDVRMLRPEVDERVADLLMRCLDREPENRFADGNTAAAAIESLLQNLTGTSSRLLAVSQSDATVSVPAPSEDPVSVLCVDDNQEILSVLRDVLEDGGFAPVCFTDAHEALGKLSSIKPHAAIVDLEMPQMSGVELCQRIRETEGFAKLGVLVLSGVDSPARIKDSLAKGITDFLVKPVNIVELVTRVKLLVRLHAMNQERELVETQLNFLKRKTVLMAS